MGPAFGPWVAARKGDCYMKIYRCKELLRLPRCDRDGNSLELPPICVAAGMVFTAEEATGDAVRLEGLRGMRLSVSRQTLEKHFEELA